MANDEAKRRAARAAMRYVQPGTIVGVGTGSTVAHFIDALAEVKATLAGTLSSSEQSSAKLRAYGIPVLDPNDVARFPLYVDGADEVDGNLMLIKGGGGALTREKILAAMAERFVCIVDPSKKVDVLGRFPLPVEVIPMARAHVARELERRGGRPVWRSGFVTDNGNVILDVHELRIVDPVALEADVSQIVGVVTVGLFAKRAADELIVGE
jgi:ribose 5-phosphate isomerase A